jgi:hypothetical protein
MRIEDGWELVEIAEILGGFSGFSTNFRRFPSNPSISPSNPLQILKKIL